MSDIYSKTSKQINRIILKKEIDCKKIYKSLKIP